MRLFQIMLAFAAFFATLVAQGEPPAASRDTNLLLILPGTAAGRSTTSRTTLTPQDAEGIARQCPAISQVAPIVQPPAHLSYGNRHWHPSHFIGSTPSFLTAREWRVSAGTSFTDVDVRNAAKVCLIGETVKQKMFRDESPIGKTIHFQNDGNIPFRAVDFRVIGILGHRDSDVGSTDEDDIVLVPWTTIEHQPSEQLNNAAPQTTRLTTVDQILAKAASAEVTSQAIRQIAELLRARHHIGPDQKDDFHIRDINSMGHQMRRAMARLRFAPMWIPVPRFSKSSNTENALPVPAAAYSEVWQPQWQEELGLSVEQKSKLAAINAKAMAEAKDHTERFKKMPQEEQQAQVKAWAGKSAPWRQQLDNEVCGKIEEVLTPNQLQTLKDYSFPAHAIGFLYDVKIRQEIGFGPKQEDQFRRIAKERLARFQAVSMERAEKQWSMLTLQQQAAFPEVVKRQGPTSAVLSIAWDLGFDPDNIVPGYPMLGESPVRKRLGLSAEQEKQLQSIMADSAARKEKERQERFSRTAQPSHSPPDSEANAKKQVEAILTPQQRTTLNEINFHRQVALALGYPEKRKTVGITAQQEADFQRLDNKFHEQLYRIDREMLGQALEVLTPRQRQQLHEEADRRRHGDLPAKPVG